MSFLYDTAFFFFALFYLPVFILKSGQAENRWDLVRQRFGVLPGNLKESLRGKRIVWLHAVSVGETIAIQPFVEKFLDRYPGYHLLITTVTPTGQKIARKMAGERVSTAYFPFDFSFSVKSFFRTFGPEALLLAETEIWPNLILEASKRKIPVIILNGRLSEKSAARYGRFRVLFEPLFSRLERVLAQTEKDAVRFHRLGLPLEKTGVTGNIKYDNFDINLEREPLNSEIRAAQGLSKTDKIFLAGSTHPGEDEILMAVFQRLRKDYSGLFLIIVPRHIERSAQILSSAGERGLKAVLSAERKDEPYEVLIVNQLGVLKQFYAAADVVFMGGSLVPKGGQNPIEAAAFRRPIVHGPNVFNFEEVYRLLDEGAGALRIQDEEEFYLAVKTLLDTPQEREKTGRNAYQEVCSMRGATLKTLEHLDTFFSREKMLLKG